MIITFTFIKILELSVRDDQDTDKFNYTVLIKNNITEEEKSICLSYDTQQEESIVQQDANNYIEDTEI